MVPPKSDDPESTPDPAPGEVWVFDHDGYAEHKPRVCVVDETEDGAYWIVYGRSKAERNSKHLKVEQGTELHDAMGLHKTTHFWFESVHLVPREKLIKKIGECPYDDQIQFQELVFRFRQKRGRQG